MNSKKFSEAISRLDTRYIDEAIGYKKRKLIKNLFGLNWELWRLAYAWLLPVE